MKRKLILFHGVLGILALLLSVIFVYSFISAKTYKKPDYVIGGVRIGLKDGDYKTAEFKDPYSMVKHKNKLYLTDSGNNCIRIIDLKKKKVATFTGKEFIKEPNKCKGYKDGKLATAKFNQPKGIAVDKDGSLYIADSGNHVIRKIKKGKVYTYAGTGKRGKKNGDLKNAQFNFPKAIFADKNHVLIADTWNSVIRKLNKKNITTIISLDNSKFEANLRRYRCSERK